MELAVRPPISCPCTFRESESPHNEIDPVPVELGVRFAVDRPGWLNRVTFQRGMYRGPVTIRVWGPGGTLFHAPYIVRADAGVYRYGEGGGFPTDTWHHSNYTIYPSFVS
jgi:hypothetical protein